MIWLILRLRLPLQLLDQHGGGDGGHAVLALAHARQHGDTVTPGQTLTYNTAHGLVTKSVLTIDQVSDVINKTKHFKV